jgi:hypothetical protein
MAKLSFWKRKKKERPEEKGVEELPPFLSMAAVYRDRLRMAKLWTIAISVVAVGLIVMQEARFHGALGKYTNREILIVPGAVDFMRVRPNMLPDNAVYFFAEYVAERVGTFNHATVESRSAQLGEFFTPQFRERYMAEIRKALPRWKELAVSEVFAPQPANKFVLQKDDKGSPHYVVDVIGQLERYSNDNRLVSSPEVITVKFRTARVQAAKPWFFEVEDISRMSLEDWQRDKDARERLVRR